MGLLHPLQADDLFSSRIAAKRAHFDSVESVLESFDEEAAPPGGKQDRLVIICDGDEDDFTIGLKRDSNDSKFKVELLAHGRRDERDEVRGSRQGGDQ